LTKDKTIKFRTNIIVRLVMDEWC